MTLCNIKNDVNYWETNELKQIFDNSLILYYTSDNGDNVTWIDRSMYNNNGLLYNTTRTPVHSSNIFGSSLKFNAISNSSVLCGNSSILQLTGAMTAIIWYKEDFAEKGYKLICKSGVSGQRGWVLGTETITESTGTFIASIASDPINSTYVESDFSDGPTPGTINCIGMTYKPSTSLSLYKNGYKLKEKVTGIPAMQYNPPLPVYIGRRSDGIQFLNGTIYSALLCNRALTPSEMLTNYQNSFMYYIQRSIN